MWRGRDERQEAFLSHLNEVRPRLLGFCRHALRHPGDLEDTVQNIMVTSFENFSEFQPGTNFHAWIFRIATHVVFNANRRHVRERERHPDVDPAELDVVAELQREYAYEELLRDPGRVLNEVGDEVHTALGELPRKEQTVFLLKTIGGLPCREISEILDMPVGSVMGYLARARGKLRARLTEYAKKYGFLSSDVKQESSNGLPND